MKKLQSFAVAALAVGMAATLAGCGGCAGCSSNSKNLTSTVSNWFTDGYSGIQQSFIAVGPDGNETGYAGYKEIINYDVAFDEGKGNRTYSVDYTNGSFRTEFYAVYYNWNDEKIPEAYRVDAKEVVYYYKTELNISVQYKMTASGEQSEIYRDSIVNEAYFRAAGKNLQPVYSSQRLISRSPANLQAGSLGSAIKTVNVGYENFYSFDCREVLSTTTDYSENAEGSQSNKTYKKLNKVKNSLFDNSSLYIAVRSMGLTTEYNQTVSVFSAAGGGVSNYTVKGSGAALGAEERKSVSAAMEAKGLYVPVTTDAEGNTVEDAGIPTIAADISFAGGTLAGTTQRVWYAAVTNADRNQSRSTMVKLSIPLSYGLGTLNFTLKEVESTLWDE